MDPILDVARDLGKRLAEHPKVKAYLEANEAVAASASTRQILTDYESQARKIEELTAANQPVEPEDKRKLADLEQKMASDPLMKTLLKAQADYVGLMRQVQAAIQPQPEPQA
ncbi:MAG TPA: YlbF family regulator [Phycisphaerae bacterium]|jgi:cell fate (sporulation/competence/biofilm development) regulator YlbF (YheA/YmcA/DUF963 family)